MSKFKYKRKKNSLVVKAVIEANESINYYEYDYLIKHKPYMLFEVELKKINKIVCSCDHFLGLNNYLTSSLNECQILDLIGRINDSLIELNNFSLKAKNVLFDLNTWSINALDGGFRFVYLPIRQSNSNFNYKDFILSIIDSQSLNDEKIVTFKNWLLSKNNISVDLVDEYYQLNNISKSEKSRKDYIDESFGEQMPLTTSFEEEQMPVTVAFEEEQMPVTVAFEEEQMPLTVAYCDEDILNNRFFIVRTKTGEKIELSTNPFVIGKKNSLVDYCIYDNTTISRRHASIIKECDNVFYLMDLDSVNKSYVEGVLALPNVKTRIYKGTRFYLSNEEFIFDYE